MAKSKMFNIQRSYAYDSSDDNPHYAGISESAWRQMIDKLFADIVNSGHVERMAYIYHDKDPKFSKDGKIMRDKKGNPIIAPLHVHAVVEFKNPMERSAVVSGFGLSDEENGQVTKNIASSFRYLTHMTDKAIGIGKYIYSMDEVKTFNCNYREVITEVFWGESVGDESDTKSRNKALKVRDELGRKVLEGEIRRDDAEKLFKDKVGYKWWHRLSHMFDKDQDKFIENEVKRLVREGRNLTHVYIMGSGGTGKSSLANELAFRLAKGRGVKVAAPAGKGKTPDIFEGCKDESTLIVNEQNAGWYNLDEFNVTYDRTKYVSASSRGSNSDFIGDTIISTNSYSPLRFAKDMLIYSKGGKAYQDPSNKREINMNNPSAVDDYWQVRRRFSHVFVLIRDENNPVLVNAYIFRLRTGVLAADGSINLNDGTHILVGQVTFKSVPDSKPEITSEVLDKIEALMSVDVSNAYSDVKNIDTFLEENGIVESIQDDLLSAFVGDVVKRCVWDLLPSKFLFALYRRYRDMYYPQDDVMSLREFTGSMERLLADDWEYKEQVRTSNRMDADEPLISEYGLDKPYRDGKPNEWYNAQYAGGNPQMKRNFKRKDRYAGFVRK